jgi:hypothetical protein
MAQLTLKGFIKEVGKVELIGDNATKKQAVILTVLPRKDDFGADIGKEETWCIFAFGEGVDKLKLSDCCNPGDKAELSFYVNSYFVDAKPETKKDAGDGRPAFFSQNNILKSITIL